ncbi:DUF167 domain-containing protein [Patescibacteria group bacterium]|nr:DUF167 domain-containing protein [Patescibacteria group bacterium]
MKIFVKVKPRTKTEKFEKIDDNHFLAATKEPPEKGKANQAIIKKLAKYFKVATSQIIFVSGFSSKNKVFAIK